MVNGLESKIFEVENIEELKFLYRQSKKEGYTNSFYKIAQDFELISKEDKKWINYMEETSAIQSNLKIIGLIQERIDEELNFKEKIETKTNKMMSQFGFGLMGSAAIIYSITNFNQQNIFEEDLMIWGGIGSILAGYFSFLIRDYRLSGKKLNKLNDEFEERKKYLNEMREMDNRLINIRKTNILDKILLN